MPLRDKYPENICCLAIFLLRKALHEIELNSTFVDGLQQLSTPLHSVWSPLQQFFSRFYGSFSKEGACAHFSFFFQRSTARQFAEKIAGCNKDLI